MKEINVKTSNDLFELLVYNGGKIVSSNSVSVNEINQARASNRMLVDENGLGFIWIPTFKNPFPETVEEVEMFEKCYPLDEKPVSHKLAHILSVLPKQ